MQSENLMIRAMNSFDLRGIGSVFVDVVTEMDLPRLANILSFESEFYKHTT